MGVHKDKNSVKTSAKLRRHAEELLKANTPESGIPHPDDEIKRILHELQVHQIELEMQNAELRQTREELEMALEKYTDIYDFAPVGYFTFNRKGAISAANLSGASMLGIERASLPGRLFGLFVTEESRPLFAAFLGKVFASQSKQSCEVTLTTEANLPRIVQIEAVVFGPGQECHAALIDITERKRAEESLRHSEALYRAIGESINYGIWICAPDGRNIYASDSFLHLVGITRERCADFGWGAVLHPDDAEQTIAAWKECVSTGGTWDREHRYRGADGQWHPVLARGVPVRDDQGSITSWAGINLDIRNMKNTEKKLRDSEERLRLALSVAEQANNDLAVANIELEAFNFSVSHDLRSPLTIINGYCQMVLELCGSKLDGRTRGYIQEMYNGSLRMNQLIDALLVFSRITRIELRHDKVDLSKMAEEVAMILKVSNPERLATFRIADGITADGDAVLLRSVLDNLISNAWKYSGNQERAVIEFGTMEIDGKSTCFVKDNGPGFDRAHLDKLFIPFQRLPGTKVKGHGIGLATVDRIIKRHGGRVWAEGEPGKGACFYFTLAAD